MNNPVILPMERFVFDASVVVAAKTVMMFDDLTASADAIGILDAAEIEGSPLNELFGRAIRGSLGPDDITEYGGRQCYASWTRGRPNEEYLANIIRDGHGSVQEHANIVFQVSGVSRSLTLELIRHRVGTAISQESQRYVDAKDMTFVIPPLILTKYDCYPDRPTDEQLLADPEFLQFQRSCSRALEDYIELQAMLDSRLRAELDGLSEEEAVKRKTSIKKRVNEASRSELPNASETQMLYTTNIRALRHIVELRGSVHADLEIRRFAQAILNAARPHAPNSLRDLEITHESGDEFMRGVARKVI